MFSNPMKLAWALMFVGIALFAFSGQGAVQAFEAPTATETASPTTQSAAPAAATATSTPTETKAPTATAEKPTATATTKATATATTEATATATTEATATSEKPTATFTPVPSTDTPTATNTSQAATATPTLKATATTTSTAETATVTPTVEITATATPTVAATETVTPTTQATATVTPTITATPTPTATLKAPARALSPSGVPVSSLSTAFVIQNTDPISTANVSAMFYDSSGTATGPIAASVAPYKSTIIDQRTAGGVPGSPSTYQGSVVLSSNTQLASVVDEYGGSSNLGVGFRFDTYTGLSSTDASTSVLLPQLLKNIYDTGQAATYNSVVAIQNTNATISATVAITYFNQVAQFQGTYTHQGIMVPPNSAVLVDMQTESALASVTYFYGPASISSDQPVVVVVNQSAGGILDVYSGFTNSNAATTLYAPQLLKGVYDTQQQVTWGTGIMVMTADQSSASVTITYVNQVDGSTTSETKVANPAATFDQRFGNWGTFYGSATLVSSKPIVALTNMVTNSSGKGVRASTYRALTDASGSLSIFLPQVFKNYLDTGSGMTMGTGAAVRLLGSTSGTVTITVYNNYNGAVRTSTQNISPSSPLVTFDQRFDPSLSDQSVVNGSAVISSTVPVAATVNTVGSNTAYGDAAGTYAGVGQ